MSRIININNPSKVRNQNQRTIAEILRRLAAKPAVDDEVRDMAAALVYLLREIYAVVNSSAEAWEKRGYWMKADRFLREWRWTAEIAANFEDVIRNDAWDLLPHLMGDLLSHTAQVQVKSLTRPSSAWQGAYRRLMSEPPSEFPW